MNTTPTSSSHSSQYPSDNDDYNPADRQIVSDSSGSDNPVDPVIEETRALIDNPDATLDNWRKAANKGGDDTLTTVDTMAEFIAKEFPQSDKSWEFLLEIAAASPKEKSTGLFTCIAIHMALASPAKFLNELPALLQHLSKLPNGIAALNDLIQATEESLSTLGDGWMAQLVKPLENLTQQNQALAFRAVVSALSKDTIENLDVFKTLIGVCGNLPAPYRPVGVKELIRVLKENACPNREQWLILLDTLHDMNPVASAICLYDIAPALGQHCIDPGVIKTLLHLLRDINPSAADSIVRNFARYATHETMPMSEKEEIWTMLIGFIAKFTSKYDTLKIIQGALIKNEIKSPSIWQNLLACTSTIVSIDSVRLLIKHRQAIEKLQINDPQLLNELNSRIKLFSSIINHEGQLRKCAYNDDDDLEKILDDFSNIKFSSDADFFEVAIQSSWLSTEKCKDKAEREKLFGQMIHIITVNDPSKFTLSLQVIARNMHNERVSDPQLWNKLFSITMKAHQENPTGFGNLEIASILGYFAEYRRGSISKSENKQIEHLIIQHTGVTAMSEVFSSLPGNEKLLLFGLIHDSKETYNEYSTLYEKLFKSVVQNGRLDFNAIPEIIALQELNKQLAPRLKWDILLRPNQHKNITCINICSSPDTQLLVTEGLGTIFPVLTALANTSVVIPSKLNEMILRIIFKIDPIGQKKLKNSENKNQALQIFLKNISEINHVDVLNQRKLAFDKNFIKDAISLLKEAEKFLSKNFVNKELQLENILGANGFDISCLENIREKVTNNDKANIFYEHFTIELMDKEELTSLMSGEYLACCLAPFGEHFHDGMLERLCGATWFPVVTKNEKGRPVGAAWVALCTNEEGEVDIAIDFCDSSADLQRAKDVDENMVKDKINLLMEAQLKFVVELASMVGAKNVWLGKQKYGRMDLLSVFTKMKYEPVEELYLYLLGTTISGRSFYADNVKRSSDSAETDQVDEPGLITLLHSATQEDELEQQNKVQDFI
jgi:hypothetical protein